ncbi:serine/threonine-protein kinase [Crateriforma conspicua]|uniref:serine/threonine-protein kinase n=1 Tax=Crateriforma conspicua TaxID=2527996 RepID=UPI0021BCD791|nr:serine/threonine-protein kinase [Crateriforma conspicua]
MVSRFLKRRRSPRSPSNQIPTRIGPYVITGPLARGGMSTVHLARHINLGRPVAIKWMENFADLDGGVVPRHQAELVLNEWRAHGRLSHPNIVSATDAGLINHHPFLVMEWIDGLDLSSLIKTTGPLHVIDACEIVRQMANAFAYVHDHGVVHADIKPSNAMLDRSGVVKVLDLGTAALDDQMSGEKPQFGTLAFMAPERIEEAVTDPKPGESVRFKTRNDPNSAIRSEIYSLGCTMYFLLSQKSPHEKSTTSELNASKVLQAVSRGPVAITITPTQGSPDLRGQATKLIERLLAPKPSDRFQSMHDIAEELTRLIQTFESEATPNLSLLIRDRATEKPLPDATGHTVGITDLLDSPSKPTAARRLALVACSCLALAVIAYGSLRWLNRSHSRSSPNRLATARIKADQATSNSSPITPDISPPETLLSKRGVGYTVFGPEYASFLKYRPQANVDFFSTSKQLLGRMQRLDPTITNASITTVAPRDRVIQAEWSYDGRRLAVITERYHLRIYHWNGHRLEIAYKTRGEGTSGWVKTICWDPNDGALIAASQSFLGRFYLTEPNNYQVDILRVAFSDIESIDTLTDQGDTLLAVQSAQKVLLYDLQSGDVITDFAKDESLVFDAMGDGPSCLLKHPLGIDRWTVQRVASKQERGQGSTKRWNFWRTPIQLDRWREVSDIRFLAGNKCFSVTRKTDLVVHSWDDLQSLATHDFGQARPLHHQWLPSSDGSYRRLLLADLVGARLLGTDDLSPGDSIAVNKPLRETRCAGDQLYLSLFALNPTTNGNTTQLAAFWRGTAEIWDSDLRTIASLPQTRAFRLADPLPNQSGFSIFCNDGSGVFVGSDGKFISRPVPSLAPGEQDCKVIQESFLDGFTGTLHQSRTLSSRIYSRPVDHLLNWDQSKTRHAFSFIPSLVRYGVNDVTQVPEAHRNRPWGYCRLAARDSQGNSSTILLDSTQRTYRLAFSRDADRFCHYTGEGRYRIYEADNEHFHSVASGYLAPFGNWTNARISHDGKTIFVAGSRSDSITVVALLAQNAQEIWRYRSTRLKNLAQIAMTESGNLLVCNEREWLVLDKETGKAIETIDTRLMFGFRQDRVRQSYIDQSIISWPRTKYVQPLAIWSPDVKLQCLVFACGNDRWISLTPDGRIIDQTESAVGSDRMIRNSQSSSGQWMPAESTSSGSAFAAADSLIVVCHHGDDNQTLHTFADVNTGR